MNIRSYALMFLFITGAWTGCQQSEKAPDVSGIPMDVQLSRFDEAFIGLDTNHLQVGLEELNSAYPVFFPVYMNNIMNFPYHGDSTSAQVEAALKQYLGSPDIHNLQDSVRAHFGDRQMGRLEAGLTKSFRYIKYYLPDFHPPRVVTFTSALSNFGAITVDSVLGIGLDMFMGAEFPLYKQIPNPYPGYILKQFTAENIIGSAVRVIAQDRYPPPQKGTLLDQMVAQGKLLYFLDKTMPDSPDSIKIHYSTRELAWCKKNEQFIWQYFIRNNLLYKTEALTIRYYIGPSPSSKGMPAEAPGDIGSWVGWQIVRKYMDTHPDTRLSDLMQLTNGQQLLNEAGYKPH